MIIYLITNKINGKQYVGQTVRTLEERFKEHKRKNGVISRAIKKYGAENFTYELIDTAESMDELNKKEIEHIQRLGTTEPFGYNLCYGGNNTMGYNHREESKKKMSLVKKKKGSHVGERNHFYGKKHTEETRAKMKEAWRTKRVMTEEWRQKLKDNHPTRKVINLTTGEEFESIKEAAEKYGLKETHISRVCRGGRKTTGGFRWAYAEDLKDMAIPSQASTIEEGVTTIREE